MDKDKIAYEELLKGIQNYVKQCMDNIGYDKTYTAIIKSKNNNKYSIILQGIQYDDVKTIGGECYVNETVHVLIPNNNFSNMIILKG